MRDTLLVASILLALTARAQADDDLPSAVQFTGAPITVKPELITIPDDGCAPVGGQPAPAKRQDPEAPIEWKSPTSVGQPPVEAQARPALEPVTIAPLVEMKCGGGKVLVHVKAPTHVSHYTGEKIPVTLEVVLAPGAVIDLHSIDVNENGSGYELVGEPQPHVEKVDEVTKVTIELWIQSFETGRQNLPVSLTLRYATIISEEGTPLWQDLVTNDLQLIHHDVVPSGTKAELLMASLDAAQSRISWAYVPCLVIAFALLGAAVLLFAVRAINRVRSPQTMSPQMSTWLALDKLIVSGNEIGFTQAHYEKISAALKSFLQVRYHLGSFELGYVAATMSGEPAGASVVSALTILQAAVYNSEKLSRSRHDELVFHLRTIVPKPFSL